MWTKYTFMRNKEVTTLSYAYFTPIYQLRHINTKLTAHTSLFPIKYEFTNINPVFFPVEQQKEICQHKLASSVTSEIFLTCSFVTVMLILCSVFISFPRSSACLHLRTEIAKSLSKHQQHTGDLQFHVHQLQHIFSEHHGQKRLRCAKVDASASVHNLDHHDPNSFHQQYLLMSSPLLSSRCFRCLGLFSG